MSLAAQSLGTPAFDVELWQGRPPPGTGLCSATSLFDLGGIAWCLYLHWEFWERLARTPRAPAWSSPAATARKILCGSISVSARR